LTRCAPYWTSSGKPPEIGSLVTTKDENRGGRAARRCYQAHSQLAVRGLDPKQKRRCLDIIRETYEQLAGNTAHLGDLVDVAEQRYTDNDWPDDSLLALAARR
jgi:hypothetical protein